MLSASAGLPPLVVILLPKETRLMTSPALPPVPPAPPIETAAAPEPEVDKPIAPEISIPPLPPPPPKLWATKPAELRPLVVKIPW